MVLVYTGGGGGQLFCTLRGAIGKTGFRGLGRSRHSGTILRYLLNNDGAWDGLDGCSGSHQQRVSHGASLIGSDRQRMRMAPSSGSTQLQSYLNFQCFCVPEEDSSPYAPPMRRWLDPFDPILSCACNWPCRKSNTVPVPFIRRDCA